MPAGQIGMALVTVLGVADAVAQYALTLMMTYLTNVWDLGLKKSATIVNLYSGTVAILPLGIHFIAQVREGDYWTLVFSSFSYMAGFVLLTISTPSILARVTGSTCSTDEPQCIGQVHRILCYTALPLIAVGVAGYSVSREKFVSRQWGDQSPPVSVIAVLFLLGTVGVTAVGYANPWWIKFGIPAGFILVATLIFLSASSFYNRCNAQDEFPLGKRDIKATIYMSFFCIVFTIVGVVSSTGNTYFMEAADSMDGKIRGFKVPVLILPFISTSVKYATVKFGRKCPAVIRIIVAGVLATLCCFTAAIVENRRLSVVKSHGLIDKPGETVPMSMFWLIPQFLLLGGAGGLLESGVTALYTGSVLVEALLNKGITLEYFLSRGMEGGPAYQHGLKCVKAFYGAGIIGSVLFVLGGSKIKPSWFHRTLNASRLDDYYWTLGVLTAADSLLLGLLWGAWLIKPWRHVGPSALLTSFYKLHNA